MFMNNDIKFLHTEWRTLYPLKNFEILKTVLDCVPQLFFRLQYVWFPVHLYTDSLPNSSGQLTELIVHIIPLE